MPRDVRPGPGYVRVLHADGSVVEVPCIVAPGEDDDITLGVSV